MTVQHRRTGNKRHRVYSLSCPATVCLWRKSLRKLQSLQTREPDSVLSCSPFLPARLVGKGQSVHAAPLRTTPGAARLPISGQNWFQHLCTSWAGMDRIMMWARDKVGYERQWVMLTLVSPNTKHAASFLPLRQYTLGRVGEEVVPHLPTMGHLILKYLELAIVRERPVRVQKGTKQICGVQVHQGLLKRSPGSNSGPSHP